MDGTRRLVLMAVIGILVAAAIIGGVNAIGLPSGNPTTTTIVSKVTSLTTTVSTSIETATKISNSTAPEGTMAVQIADSLNLPSGVTAVYLQYSDIEVHTIFGNSSYWVRVATGNSLDLSDLSSNGITVGVTAIPSETYDAARMIITSTFVTFEGKNLTTILPETEISVPIGERGIDLFPNATDGILFDVSPTIVPLASSTGTEFELIPYAEVLAIPTSVPAADYAILGSSVDLDSQPWFTATQTNLPGNLTVVAALVSDNAMLVVLKNTGNATITINGLSLSEPGSIGSNLVTIVTTITTVTTITEYSQNSSAKLPRDVFRNLKSFSANSGARMSSLPLSAYETVASFFVLGDGQVIVPSSASIPAQLGLVLAPGQNATLTFVGTVQTLDSLSAPYAPLQISPGSPYLLQVQGPFGQSEEINVTAISPF
jgi:hypothetical protein